MKPTTSFTLVLMLFSMQAFSQNCGSVFGWQIDETSTSSTHSDYKVIFGGRSTSGGTKSINNFEIICGSNVIYSATTCYNTAPRWDPPLLDSFTFNGISCNGNQMQFVFNGRTTAACGGTTCLTRDTANNNTPVPVNWLDFRASCLNETILIEWATASEINNSGFEIQQFVEGETWNRVGWVSAKNAGYQTQHYSFKLDKELNKSGIYRLKQNDYDGQFDYSKVAQVNCNQIDVVVYPNPATDLLNFSDEVSKVVISNLYGVEVVAKEDYTSSVDIALLEEGIYVLQYEVNGQRISKRLSVDRSN